MRAKQSEYGDTVIDMDVMPDHVHLLLDADPREGMIGMVATITGSPSHALRNEFPWRKKRVPTRWTRSTFIASVEAVTLDVAKQSIEDQRRM